MQPSAPADEEVPVLIVGGGGAGLTASMLLADASDDPRRELANALSQILRPPVARVAEPDHGMARQ